MGNKRTFCMGLLAGLVLMAAMAVGYAQLLSRLQWGDKMSPESKIREVYRLLDAYSINTYEKGELLESMYIGLLDGVGDPYTYYFDEEALTVFTEQTEGIYGGVGMEVSLDPEDSIVTVVTVYEGAPGDQAGLQAGDKITRVDGTDVTGHPLNEVTALTKGKAGTSVTLTIYREVDNSTFDAVIVREVINIPTVSHKMLDDGIGYIQLKGFERVTLNQFSSALGDLRAQDMRGLILDLRNNPGGLLDTVTQIADLLLPRGVITYTEDKRGERKYYYSDENELGLPLVLLVNENSASASEVLCGAVRDAGAGLLVGVRTFGKGIVQNLYNMSDGSAIKITVAKYYTPNGICIHDVGIEPDYVVETDKETTARIGHLPLQDDAQLQKAVAVMQEQLG